MVRHPTRKPKTLRTKNIKRKTGAKSQAKQIVALSRQVSKINKEQYQNIRTSWQRNVLPIGLWATAHNPYICPLPYVVNDPLGNSPITSARFWTDSKNAASQPTFVKRLVFGYSEAAVNSPKIYHTGGILRYQIYTSEPTYTKVGLFLIRPKKAQADQLVLDRKFKAGGTVVTTPGSQSKLTPDVDFLTHSGVGTVNTLFGSEINRKYWDVLYKREIGLSTPTGAVFDTIVSASTSSPNNNALVASGTIRLPPGGEIKNVSTETQTTGNLSAPAIEAQYLDQRNENSCYLVAIHNDVTIDLQSIDMGFVITDYYKAVV